MPVVTRFAPSPSGALHLGNARTALFSALFARRAPGGRFLLRIEDSDAARSSETHVVGLIEDLRWLGLAWDGEPLRQSARSAVYAAALSRLEDAGHAYPCFCTPEALEAQRRAQAFAGRPPRYDGTCRGLDTRERQARRAAGEASTLRFAVPLSGKVAFEDLVHGPRRFECADLGDFVLRRADGSPAFLFCNALDDAESGVTHVLRGEDHLTNTPRQLLLLAALGRPAPRYGHLSLITGDDGTPLSKRHGATSAQELRERGYLPRAVLNHLFRLGHSCAENVLLDLPAMAAAFNPAHLQRSPAHFDLAQLRHWQCEALQALTADEALAWLAPLLPETATPVQRSAFVQALRPNLLLPAEAQPWVDIVFGTPPPLDEAAQAAIKTAAPGLLAAAAQAAAKTPDDFKAIAAAARDASGAKGAALFKPLRAALTGCLHGPELAPLLAAFPPGVVPQRFARFL